ncbi:MAG: putative kinesin light chain 1, partial [Spirosoma sp.]|nr:putative kinesin light chain 1 [Spirosoma sp.]
RLASQHELAGAYEADGQIKKAVALLEQVVAVQERTLAEDHPDRLASQHALAGAYQADGPFSSSYDGVRRVAVVKSGLLGLLLLVAVLFCAWRGACLVLLRSTSTATWLVTPQEEADSA